MKRLTVNYGARFEHFAHGIPDETSPAGRFTAARTFGPIDWPTWNSFSPRVGAVYDLFGNQKTALKFSIGKYMTGGIDRVLGELQPARTDVGNRGLDRREQRRRAAGRARLRLPDRRLRDQPRPVAERIRRGQPRQLRSRHQADVQHRDGSQRPARSCAGRFGDRRLVPSRLQEPAAPRQHVCRRLPTTRRSRCTARSTARRSRTTT